MPRIPITRTGLTLGFAPKKASFTSQIVSKREKLYKNRIVTKKLNKITKTCIKNLTIEIEPKSSSK